MIIIFGGCIFLYIPPSNWELLIIRNKISSPMISNLGGSAVLNSHVFFLFFFFWGGGGGYEERSGSVDRVFD